MPGGAYPGSPVTCPAVAADPATVEGETMSNQPGSSTAAEPDQPDGRPGRGDRPGRRGRRGAGGHRTGRVRARCGGARAGGGRLAGGDALVDPGRDPLGRGGRHRDQPLRVRAARRHLGGAGRGRGGRPGGDQPARPAHRPATLRFLTAVGAGLLVGLVAAVAINLTYADNATTNTIAGTTAAAAIIGGALAGARNARVVGGDRRRRADHADLRGGLQPRPGPALRPVRRGRHARSRCSAPRSGSPGRSPCWPGCSPGWWPSGT